MEIRNFIMIVFLSVILVGCNFKKVPTIRQQELLYNYSKTDDNFEVTLKTVLEMDEKLKEDKYFLVLENNKLELIPRCKVYNGVEYVSYIKTKEATYGDSIFVRKIKNSIIMDSKDERVIKNKNYKFDVRSTLWVGNDKEKPYINFR
ncbi:hypothetical protein JSO56_05740 [Riemerella anatipestifer]|uniref:hypothetical protein n=1 Tax=Riemerella anatipestifer TaxID=34085 RepID=UPI0030BBDBB5